MAGRGGRNDDALAEVLGMIAGVLGGGTVGTGIGSDRQLGNFQRNNPPLFMGEGDPEGVHKWREEIGSRVLVIDCAENLKVRLGTHMLSDEADARCLETKGPQSA